MKPWLLMTALLVLCAVSAGADSGVNLSWGNRCSLDGNIPNLDWACDDNTNESIRLTCTYMVPETKTNLAATDIYLVGWQGETWWPWGADGPIPDWWRLDPAGCRANAVSMSTDGSVTSCRDPWNGAGEQGGGIGYYRLVTGPYVELAATWAVANLATVNGNEESFAAQFRFNTANTVGDGVCGGCTTPLCWAINYIQVAFYGETQAPQLGLPFSGGQQVVTWQQGRVPARPATWGRIKSLYR